MTKNDMRKETQVQRDCETAANEKHRLKYTCGMQANDQQVILIQTITEEGKT